MDSDDLLLEILLRLSPHPSSLPHASLVCTRWRRLVTNPIFLDRFRARHGKPPILGVFFDSFHDKPSFSPTLDPPDSIPPERFSPRLEGDGWCFHGCRHGRLLLTKSDVYGYIERVLVWEPVTGDQRFLGVPRALSVVSSRVAAAVVCTVRGKGHVHGGGCPFKVILVRDDVVHRRLFAHVYSSETGAWGNLILASAGSPSAFNPRNIMVGNSLYWFVFAHELGIVEFDFDTESFAHIEVPSEAHVELDHNGIFLSTLTKSGGLGFIVMLGFTVQTWERTVDRGGVTRWLLGQIIELDNLFTARTTGWTCRKVLWIDGDHNVMFVLANTGVFMVHLESMRTREYSRAALSPTGQFPISIHSQASMLQDQP